MIKYYAIKVFVTDGKAEKNAEKQKMFIIEPLGQNYLYGVGLPFYIF